MKVHICARARRAMENELSRYPNLETGGLLLGRSDGAGDIKIMEATDGGYRNTVHEEDEFAYDPEYQAHMCEVLCNIYDPPLQVVGVWHKHNIPGEIPFSRADEDIHAQLLENDYPCVSLLLEKTDCNAYNPRMFLLRSGGEHVDMEEHTLWYRRGVKK